MAMISSGSGGGSTPKPKGIGAIVAHAIAPVAVGIQKTTGAKPVPSNPVIASHGLTRAPAYTSAKPVAPPKYLQHVAVHAGHWVVDQHGNWVPIYASGKGKWTQGFKPGTIAPAKPTTTPPKQALTPAPGFATAPRTAPIKIGKTTFNIPALTPAPAFASVPHFSTELAKSQGVSASNRAVAAMMPKPEHHGGLHIAGITIPSPAGAVKAVEGLNWNRAGHVLGHLATGVEHLPQDATQGLWELGKTAFIHPTHLPGLLDQMQKHDALAQLLQLHFKKANELAYQNPLGAATDVALGAGAVGRIAGAGRALSGAEALAPTAREALSLVPKGLSHNTTKALSGLAPVDRRFSGNLLTAKAQAELDARGGLPDLGKRIKLQDVPTNRFDREMFKRANEHQTTVSSLKETYQNDERLKKGSPIPLPKRLAMARFNARTDALHMMMRQNALRNQHTGDIFFKKGGATRAMKELEAAGTPFTRLAVPNLLREHGSGRWLVGPRGPAQEVIIPKTLHATIVKHAKNEMRSADAGIGGKSIGWVQNRFRRSVLPFSAKWIAGNTAEAGIRGPLLHGIMPWHAKLSSDLLKAMHDEGLHPEAARLRAQALQGTHFSMQDRHAREFFAEHPNANISHLGKRAGQVTHALGKPADLSFKYNSAIEQGFAHGGLGKYAAKDLSDIRRDNPGISNADAMKKLAHLYAKPEKAAGAGRYTRQVYGKYAAFGPSMSRFVHSAAPFSPWYGNAAKFMGTLPFRHPIATTALLSAARATDKQWAAEHKKVYGLGPEIGSFPMTGPQQALDIARYMPTGAFTAGAGAKDPLSAAVADFLPILGPQVSSAALAAYGLDPFGRQLLYPGPAQKYVGKGARRRLSTSHEHQGRTGLGHAGNVVSALLGGTTGFYPQARRVLGERGSTPYTGTDLLWNPSPPTKQQKSPLNLAGILKGLDKVFNPVHPINLTPSRPKRKSSSGRPGGGVEFGGGRGTEFR